MILLTQRLEREQTLDSNNTFTNALFSDLFVTALEGGINYWALVNDYDYKNCSAIIIDKEASQSTQYNVDLNTVKKGLEALSLETSALAKRKISSILNEDYDAEDADIVLQYGLFGKLIYG